MDSDDAFLPQPMDDNLWCSMIDATAVPTNPVYKLHVSYMSCWKLEVDVQNTLSQGLGYITSFNRSISEKLSNS